MNRLKLPRSKPILAGILAALLIVALTAGALIARPIENKTSKIQPDWSRGLRIGKTPWNQPASIAVPQDGQRVHLAWLDNGPAGPDVHYLQLDKYARRAAERQSETLQGALLSARILLDQQDRPHIFVIARMPGETVSRVIHWSLNVNGTPRTPLQPVSPPNVEVESYAVTPGPTGTFQIFWAADPGGDASGLYYTRLDADGQAAADSRRLNERPAQEVAAQTDRAGSVHVIWGEAFSGSTKGASYKVRYAAFPGGDPQPTEGTPVEQVDAPPRLGLDAQKVYVLWGQEVKGGMMAGMGFTNYTSFPIGQPASTTMESLFIPSEGRPEYLPYKGEYGFQTLADAASSRRRNTTDLLHSPSPVAGQHNSMAVATIAALTFGLNERIVPALVVLQDGRPVGYQVIAYNDGFNSQPSLAADPSGNLYVTWLTGSTGAGFIVYYAATTASARAQLDSLDLTDVLVAGVTTAWQMLGGLALLPFVPLLVVPALIIVVAFNIFGSGSEGLGDRRSYILLVLSCTAYWLTKEILLGSVLTETIFARGLEGWTRTSVIWAVQLIIAGVSGLATWQLIVHKKTDSIFWSMLIFVGFDMVLTMLTTGPTLAQRG